MRRSSTVRGTCYGRRRRVVGDADRRRRGGSALESSRRRRRSARRSEHVEGGRRESNADGAFRNLRTGSAERRSVLMAVGITSARHNAAPPPTTTIIQSSANCVNLRLPVVAAADAVMR